MTDVAHAKVVCEACLLGIETDGVTPSVNPSVQGVGIGPRLVHSVPTKETSLQVYVDRKLPPALLPPDRRIPEEFEGVPTDVIETGIFRIGRRQPPIYQRRVRPAPPGVSIGHREVSAGTFGALVKGDGERYMLSNSHVLANEGRAAVGDAILQPGRYDGGRVERDTIAVLAASVPLERDGTNAVDAALATPLSADDVTPEVLRIGRIAGLGEPNIDMVVRKSGRTTRYTEGRVTALDVTLRVMYSSGFLVFSDQFLVGGRQFSGPGDSGAVIVNAQNEAVGLLFAGSPFTTVANRFSNVASTLKVAPVR